MNHTTMAHLLHGISISLEKRAAELEDLLSSPDSLTGLKDAKSNSDELSKLKEFTSNPYLRSAIPGAAAGLGAGMAGNILGNGSWYTPVLASLAGGLGGAGIHGAINRGWINQKYAPMVQNAYPAALGGAVLGNAIFDENPILGTLGGAAAGVGGKIGLEALLKRLKGMKR
jgi:hypothetical protein